MISARSPHHGLAGAAFACATAFAAPATADEVNIYTTREPGLIEPLLEKFTEQTGITVNTLFLKDGLAERVAAEGENSPVDLLLVVDVGMLVDLKENGLTQPIESETLTAAVPAHLRDPEGHWFSLSLRARILYTAKGLAVNGFDYEDLADPKWKGKVCIRSAQHPYNTGLISAYLARHGESATVKWLNGVKANLARRPGGGDRDVARDILGGLCDLGIANSYYVGLMRSGAGGPEQVGWGEAIDVVLPTFKEGGTHVNVSGAAIARNAPNRDAAVKLLEFLVSDEGQKLYADANFEYPVKDGVPPNEMITGLGRLVVDPLPLTEIARYRAAASELVDKTGFDN